MSYHAAWPAERGEVSHTLLFFMQGLLKESMRDASLRGVHETLLLSYVTALHEARRKPGLLDGSDQGQGSGNWLDSIRHMAKGYLTTGKVWQKVFITVEEGPGDGVGGEIVAVDGSRSICQLDEG